MIFLKEKNYQLVLILIYLLKIFILFFWKNKIVNLKPIFQNLIDKIWKEKNKKNKNKFYLLPNKVYKVKSINQKLIKFLII